MRGWAFIASGVLYLLALLTAGACGAASLALAALGGGAAALAAGIAVPWIAAVRTSGRRRDVFYACVVGLFAAGASFAAVGYVAAFVNFVICFDISF